MSFDERWQESLRDLKSAFLRHVNENTAQSKASLDAQCGAFGQFIKLNQGILRSRTEAAQLVECWNAFIESVRSDLNVQSALENLLDAIDDAIGVAASGSGSPTSVTYNVGTTGAFVVGHGAHVKDVAITQNSMSATNLDLSKLADELAVLRATMRTEAHSAEEDAALGAVAEAETAARAGDRTRALERLKAAGKWALDVATKVGVEIATTALKVQLNLPT
jgi:hypothetical protein